MKKIAVVASQIEFANFIKENLECYFADYAEIIAYSIKEVSMKPTIDEEVVVLSSFTIFRQVSEKISDETILQVISFALCKDNIKKLNQIPKGSKALLINVDNRMCMQLITQIYEAGYRSLDLVPYYGDETARDNNINMAITPNELELVPKDIDTVIDIGGRVIDPNCIVELANKLGIKKIFNSEKAKNARSDVVVQSGGVEKLLSENENISGNIKALIEYIEEGMIITDVGGGIYLTNEKAKKMLKGKSEILEGFTIEDIIPGFIQNVKNGNESVIEIDGKNLIVSKREILSGENVTGNIITLKNFEEMEDKQHGIRTQIAGNNHVARFTFNDIKGESKEIKECIRIGERIAKSDSAVLIIGASGTGKEVFAQSIHNESRRNKYNFVALNCAAIPENLLESELFGYEEGAFTGAKKGGKIGYFELAHRGTIFLDEIGEMPMSLQSKLLRVLEEKKVSKVGSSKIIDIDVRVIAATNKDLFKLVNEKMFREDLYYRLNVLPLNIPNLNNREKDAILLFNDFAKDMNAKWQCSEETKKALLAHLWRGNVREVRNVVEYIDSLGKTVIEPTDLPTNFSQVIEENYPFKLENLKESDDNAEQYYIGFILREGKNIELHFYVLSVILEKSRENKKIGRGEIEKELKIKGLSYSETEIRNSMKKLADLGYIKSPRGRGGSSITSTGIRLINEIKGFIGV